jgi:phosphoribosylglycinamide formyltransferase-1
MPARLVVLVSGTGSNLTAILAAAEHPDFGAEVVAVGADRDSIPALETAKAAGVETFIRSVADYPSRADWDDALTAALELHAPDLVVCAGFMKILGPSTLKAFEGRIVNTHPALLPAFPGANAVRDALDYGVTMTGATVHIVDAVLDGGPIVAQVAVPVEAGDDEATLHERIKIAERELLVTSVGRLARGFRIVGRRVEL